MVNDYIDNKNFVLLDLKYKSIFDDLQVYFDKDSHDVFCNCTINGKNIRDILLRDALSKYYKTEKLYNKNGCMWDMRKENLSTSPLYGVSDKYFDIKNEISFIRKWGSVYEVNIIKNGKHILLGYFNNILHAYKAYSEAYKFSLQELKLNSSSNVAGNIDGRSSGFHARFFLNINGINFYLPNWYDIDDRKTLCNDIIKTHSDEFVYSLPVLKNDRHGESVERNLSLLASYIISFADEKNSQHLLPSRYLRQKKNENEINFIFS